MGRKLVIIYLKWQANRIMWKLTKIRRKFKYGLVLLRKMHPEVVELEQRFTRITCRLRELESV